MKHGLTALHKAAVTGQLACLRTLLEYNASVAKTTPDGLTAVHLAAWKGQHEAIRLLASRQADLNAKSQDGGTPLHEAVRSGDNTTVHLLLQLGAKAGVEDKVCSRSFRFLQKATINFLQLPASYLAAVRYCVMAGYCASDEIALGSAIIPCSAVGCPYFLKGRSIQRYQEMVHKLEHVRCSDLHIPLRSAIQQHRLPSAEMSYAAPTNPA
jgi:ankyrin repeat protein